MGAIRKMPLVGERYEGREEEEWAATSARETEAKSELSSFRKTLLLSLNSCYTKTESPYNINGALKQYSLLFTISKVQVQLELKICFA